MLARRRFRRWSAGAAVAALTGAAIMGVMVDAGAQPSRSTPPVAGPTARSDQASGHRMFGLSADGPERGLRNALRLSSSLHHPLDLLNFYLNWPDRFPTSSVRTIASAGVTPEITWQPWLSRPDGSHRGVPLRAIADGQYDAFIRQWAQAAASCDRPIYLRFAHEMNSNGLPWSASAPGNSAHLYVDAYRHVVDMFRAAGASNVRWIWSPNVAYRGSTPLAAVYPGRSYVDMVGLDGYNSGTAVAGSTWRTPAQVFGETLEQVRSLAPDTPVLITETASSAAGGSKPRWIRQLFAYLGAQPEVVGVVWFNLVTRADWLLNSSPADLAAARVGLRTF